jgi:glycosyltransferase involved in cell wall biosynthesis
MRLLGVVIANGFFSEVRDFANLLAERAGSYDPLVLFHSDPNPHPKDRGAAEDFERLARTETFRFDSGWRRNDDGHRSALAKAGSWATLHLQLPRLLQAARRHRPDVVYSSQQRWDCHLASMLSHALAIPHVIHLHYTVGSWLGSEVLRRMKTAAAVVCVSEFIRRQAIDHGVPASRALALHNTMRPLPRPPPGTREAVRIELGIPSDAMVFAFVARLVAEKGHADALRAMSRVVREDPSAHLLVVGDGPMGASVAKLVKELSLGERVHLLGYRKDVPALLAASDAFVHPSLNEPFGLSILEAMAAGLPTIAYRDAGPAEVIREGGFLVPPGDIDRLAEAMLHLARDRDLAAHLGTIARRDVETRFNPKTEAARFGAFLDSVRQENRVGAAIRSTT